MSGNPTSRTGCRDWLVIGSSIAGILGLIVAILAYLAPFGEVGPSPFKPEANESTSPAYTPTQTPNTRVSATNTPKPRVHTSGESTVRERDGATMVYVPEGSFTMGSQKFREEGPIHKVTLDAFWIDRTEVTNAQFERCVDAGACMASDCSGDSEFSQDRQPVVCVSWHQAKAYCEWAGGRLPTEAEWEKAARGTDARDYPWGNTAPDCSRLNYEHCPGNGCQYCMGKTTTVGKYPNGASPYGALDMAGNVWEWVNDWYDHEYYSESPSQNPLGPSTGNMKVLRGGSWKVFEINQRTARRYYDNESIDPRTLGFRCAVSP